MAGKFEKSLSPGKGNGLRASLSFAVGELVTCAEPFVYTTCKDKTAGTSVCDYCLRRSENLQRCSQCKFARYCNSLCQKKAWKDHKRECLCLKSILPNVPTDSVRLVAKIIFKLLEQPECTSGELYSVTELQSHFKDLNEDMIQGLGHLAATLEQYLKKEIPDSSKLPPGFQTLDYFCKLTCNSFTICNGEMQDIGVGLYPSMSLLNHSCDPNCVITFEGTRLHLRAVKEIPQGEELTISYIDVMMPSHMRQMQFQRQYCFTCDCNRCVSRDKDEDMLAGGEEASGAMERSLVTLEELRSQNKALKLCKKLIDESQLPSKNIYKIKALDFAMDLCIQLKIWEEALQFGLQTLEPYSLYYSNYNPVRAIQIMRVGKIQLHLGRFLEAMTTFKQVFEIVKVTHGRDSGLTKDLLELLGECEMEMNAT
ncbi:histone-lysine N-methyltransferase SMYD3 isoform X2 [Hyla sarda]|uniref:histone-lysine N-methyltransferase SMYD3 isoform X2 n=1 Tax=Hyla sarda TaxID=327740 RepID=UPI0024C284E6|nr:histone-lysine N-methyltransferase SMYD3 isoform X2 [Hyla sarda]